MNAYANVGYGQPERVGDFDIAQAHEKLQRNQLLLFVAKLGQGRMQKRIAFALFDAVGRLVLRVVGQRQAWAFTKMPANLCPHDRPEPADERAVLLMDRADDREKNAGG